MKSELSIEIDKPIEQVFELTSNHVADWSTIVVEDETLEEKNNGGEGTTFRCVTEDRGKRMEFSGVVIEHSPPHSQTVRMVGQYFDIDAAYQFEDLGDKTRVTQRSTVTGKGFTKLMFLLMAPFMKKSSCDALQKEMESLKRFVESK